MFSMKRFAFMKNSLWIVSMVLTYFFSACTTINTLYFDRLEPAQISFPNSVRKVGIVNNMPLVTNSEQGWVQTDVVLEGDGKVVAEALAQQIASTRYFDEVVISDSALCPLKVSLQEGRTLKEDWQGNMLSMEQVNEWTDKLGVDMLFSVERVRINLKKGVEFTNYIGQVSVIDGIITPMLRMYIPNRNRPFLSVTKKDTIYWHPNVKLSLADVVKESSEHIASVLLPVLLPYWEEAARNYYDGGSVDMRDAGVYLREDNWEEAYALWKKVYESKKGKQKMRAAFNLALYHELQGELEQSEKYLDVAFQLAKPNTTDAVLIQTYRIQLDSLNKKHQQLRIQMNRFGNKK